MTDEASKEALETVLRELGITKGREHGMYAPIAKRCPIRINDELPAIVKANLATHQTCACTDSNVVYVDTRLASGMFQKAREVVGRQDKLISGWRARDNYKTLLVHEYTHIIMQHVAKGVKFVRANGDKNYPIFALACDIEANRGWGIMKDSDLYQIAVSEDSYPECKRVEGLMNIYRVLKKYYGNEILESYKKLEEEENGEQESEGQGDGNGESNGESQGEGKSKSQSESSVNTSEDGDCDGSQGGNAEGEAENESEAQAQSKNREGAMRRSMSAYKKMREEIDEQAATMTEEELDKDLEHFDEETGDGIPEAGSMGTGTGEGDGEGDAKTPREVLEAGYDAYLNRKIEKSVEKLKNLVKGNQVKTRVKTYSRQSRRDGADGLIMKGVKNDKALAPRILVAMDSSGSMSSTTVTPIAKSIGSIAKSVGKTKGSYICEHDSMVKNVQPLSKWELVVERYYPSGDNDFDEVLKKAVELNVQVVLDVGDGYCRFYDKDVMAQAAAKGIKWIDVQVTGEEDLLRNIRKEDEERFKRSRQKFVAWDIIKVGEEN